MRHVIPFQRVHHLRRPEPAFDVLAGSGSAHDAGWYVVGYRADGSSLVLWQGQSAAEAQAMAQVLASCEGYERIVAEAADAAREEEQRPCWRQCPWCGQAFRRGSQSTQKYCCRDHQIRHNSQRQQERRDHAD